MSRLDLETVRHPHLHHLGPWHPIPYPDYLEASTFELERQTKAILVAVVHWYRSSYFGRVIVSDHLKVDFWSCTL